MKLTKHLFSLLFLNYILTFSANSSEWKGSINSLRNKKTNESFKIGINKKRNLIKRLQYKNKNSRANILIIYNSKGNVAKIVTKPSLNKEKVTSLIKKLGIIISQDLKFKDSLELIEPLYAFYKIPITFNSNQSQRIINDTKFTDTNFEFSPPLKSWLVIDNDKFLFSRTDSVFGITSKPTPLSYHISKCSYDYIHEIFKAKTVGISKDDKTLAMLECDCFYKNYASKYEYKSFSKNPMKYTKLEMSNGSIEKCRKFAQSSFQKLKAAEKKKIEYDKETPKHNDLKTVCNAWLIEKKFHKASWQYSEADFQNKYKRFKKRFPIDKKDLIENYCKEHVKKSICQSSTIHNMGVLPDYFIYGYPDLNVMFKNYKNSKQVALELCEKDGDFRIPSTNNPSEYINSTK